MDWEYRKDIKQPFCDPEDVGTYDIFTLELLRVFSKYVEDEGKK